MVAALVLVACSNAPAPAPNTPVPSTAIQSFAGNPNPAPLGIAVEFNWSVTGSSLSCKLDVNNDGTFEYTLANCTSASRQNHAYASAGSYTAKLQVTGADGQTQEKTAAVTVGAANQPPTVVQFVAVQGASALEVVFQIRVSDPDSVVACQLDVDGDGTFDYRFEVCAPQQPSVQGLYSLTIKHTFAKMGNYNPQLKANDQYSQRQAELNLTVPVLSGPLASNLSANPPSLCREAGSVLLSWQAVAGVTGFSVSANPALPGFPKNLPPEFNSINLNLPANLGIAPQSYMFTVTANGVVGLQPTVLSLEVAVYGQNTVCNLLDSGTGSLRQTTADAAANATVDFWPVLKGSIPLVSQITIDKNLTIQGPQHRDVMVSGQNNVRVFEFQNANLELSNLTLTQGFANEGGAIRASGGFLRLENVTIQNSTASSVGGGLMAVTNQVQMQNVGLQGNFANNHGGGAYMTNGAYLECNRCVFSNNSAGGEGGGLRMTQGSLAQLDNTRFIGNQATSGGGYFHSNSDPVFHTNLEFYNNQATNGGAMYHTSSNSMYITGARFVGNQATVAGAAVYNIFVNLLAIIDATFENNSALRGTWWMQNCGTCALIDSTMRNNQATENGGALHVQNVSPFLTNVVLENNRALAGGAIWVQNGNLTYNGGRLTNNQSDAGGGAAWLRNGVFAFTNTFWNGNQTGDHGGAINMAFGTLNLSQSQIQESRSNGDGGALWAQNLSINLDNTTIERSQTQAAGGGVRLSLGSLILSGNSSIKANSAAAGGGVYMNNAFLQLGNSSQIAGNTATDRGAGVHFTNATLVLNNNSQVRENRALGEGGGIFTSGGTLTLNDSALITLNQALNGGGVFNSGGTTLNNVVAGVNVINNTPNNVVP